MQQSPSCEKKKKQFLSSLGNPPHFMESKGSLLCSQQPANGYPPMQDKFSPCHPILLQLNLVSCHPSIYAWVFYAVFSFWFPHQNLYKTLFSSMHSACSSQHIPLGLITRIFHGKYKPCCSSSHSFF